jgi:hypothetical protein
MKRKNIKGASCGCGNAPNDASFFEAAGYRDLSDLVVRGLLSVSGQGRGTRYSLSG